MPATQDYALQQLTGYLGETSQFGPQDRTAARSNLDQSSQYYSKILKGDRNEMESLLGPEVEGIKGAYDQARKSTAEFGARGGGTSSSVAESKFNEAGEISRLIGKARPQAAAGLTQIGSLLGNLSAQETDTSTRAFENVFATLMNAKLSGQAINAESSLQLGRAIGTWLQILLGGGGIKGLIPHDSGANPDSYPPSPTTPDVLFGGGPGGSGPGGYDPFGVSTPGWMSPGNAGGGDLQDPTYQ